MAAELMVQFSLLLVFTICSQALLPVFAASSERIKTLHTTKEINNKGPYIGLITVYTPEENAFFATCAFKSHPTHPFVDLSGRRFRVGKVYNKKVIYVRCGIGMVNAATATQQMLAMFNIIGIVHFGIAGNINSSMSIGDVTIPKHFVHSGLWDWLKPNKTIDPSDFAELDFGNYNIPEGDGTNLLGRIGYSSEQVFSESGKPITAQSLVWLNTTAKWLYHAANLKGIQLERCVNSSFCLPEKPKLVVGLKGSTANMFVDNAAYREFLYQTFQVSSHDVESSAIVMTTLSNDFPVIVIRGLSDLAGAQSGENTVKIFGPLAASNTAKVVLEFLKVLSARNNPGLTS